MALFESYERRVDKINAVLAEYGISSIEEGKDITLAKGVDCDKIVRETQPICFENAVWAYTVGCAIAIKKGCVKAADAAEAIGIGLPGNGTIPAVHSGRIQLAKHAGMAIMDLVEKDIKARDIINEKSIRNALACDMALGCCSNSVLHLLAIANEAGVPVDLQMFNEISAKVPNLCHLAPAGGTHMHDLNNAGGIPAVQAELAKKNLLDIENGIRDFRF